MPIAMAPINYAHGDVVVDGRDLESLDVDGLRRLVESQREHIQALQNDLAIANGALRLMKDYGPDHHNRRISHPLNVNLIIYSEVVYFAIVGIWLGS